jgi:hypothetical protein
MKAIKSCNILCPDRSPICHGNCEIYKKFRENLDKQNKIINKKREKEFAGFDPKYQFSKNNAKKTKYEQ